ncbi:hypothetical protein [Calidifontibacter terrae]
MWVFDPIAAALLAMYWVVVWGRGREGNRKAILIAALMMVTAVLGAGWVVHPAAAVSLLAAFAFTGSLNFKRGSVQSVRALASVAVFAAAGATWAFVPLAIAGVMTLMRSGPRSRRVKSVNNLLPVHTAPAPVPTPVVDLMKAERPQTLTELGQHSRLPADSAKRVKALNLQCFQTLAYLNERGPAADRLRFELSQIHTDFAPESIRSYLALPPATATTSILRDGKTGQDLLNEQLDLLSDGVHEIQKRAEQLGAEQILTSHLFVQEKFGQRTRDLQL